MFVFTCPVTLIRLLTSPWNFYGVEQELPRLTLSEGQRNALGLCIFLAMAKQSGTDTPIILDDVVVSMDRGHRSRVATLLEKEFADRQILLRTHYCEWFFELSRFLKNGALDERAASSLGWATDRHTYRK